VSISVTCVCGKSFTVADEYAGRRGKCRACGRAVEIPGPAAASDAPFPVVVDHDEEWVEAPAPNPASRRSVAEDPSDLARDLAKLKRAVRVLSGVSALAIVVASLASYAVIATSKGPPTPAPAASSIGIVEATRFVLRHPDGTIAAELGPVAGATVAGHVALRLYGRGKAQAEFESIPGHGSRLRLLDANSEEWISLSAFTNPRNANGFADLVDDHCCFAGPL